MKLSEVLYGEEAWCQHAMVRTGGGTERYCLLGAARVAAGLDPVYNILDAQRWRRLAKAIRSVDPNATDVGLFNDASERKWSEIAEVVAMYDEVTRQEEMGL